MVYSKYFLGVLVGFCGVFSLSLQQSITAAQSGVQASAVVKAVTPSNPASNNLLPRSCPQPGELLKSSDLKWTTKDGKWTNYTPSASTKILNFLGAQWVGIKVGEIICLYQTDEAVAFPIELGQVHVQSILEPRSPGWSALVGNRRMCKSASVADCKYFIEPPKDTSNIYEEIKYAPSKSN